MARAPDRYSRLVGWLKVLLPLVAVGILVALFLVSRQTDPANAIRYGEFEAFARGSRVGAPTYSGVTEGGEAVMVRAREARLESGGTEQIVVEAPSARIETADGIAEVRADLGRLTPERDSMALIGSVQIETSDGFVIRTDEIAVELGSAEMASSGPIVAEGPMGRISADAMRLTGGAEGRRLIFTGGVRMLYHPADD